MAFMNTIKNTFARFSSETKKNYDIVKIEFKIKNCLDEADDMYKKIGKLIYKKNNVLTENDQANLEDHIDAINRLNKRIKNLEKNVSVLKSDEITPERSVVEQTGSGCFQALNKKEDDLTIRRTEEGIKILRYCPECREENPSNTDKCINCGHVFRDSSVG